MTETYEEARARIAALKATSDAAHGAGHGVGVYKEMGAAGPLLAGTSASEGFAKPLQEMAPSGSAAASSEADISAAVRNAIAEANLEG